MRLSAPMREVEISAVENIAIATSEMDIDTITSIKVSPARARRDVRRDGVLAPAHQAVARFMDFTWRSRLRIPAGASSPRNAPLGSTRRITTL
jgi:hypothetical protein